MLCLILLAVAAVAHAQNIFPQELPEVAAARFAHLQEVSRAAARVGVITPQFQPAFNPQFQPSFTPQFAPSFDAQFPTLPVARGFQSDTPEVAAAKAQHLAEHARLSGPPGTNLFPGGKTYRELF